MCKYICIYSIRGTLRIFFSSDISPEMKACKVLTYHLVLLMLQWPTYQIQVPILEMWSKSSLMSASTPKRKQFMWSRWTNPEWENKKKSKLFSKIMQKFLERAGKGTQVSWPSDQSFSYLTKPYFPEWPTKISRGNLHLQLGLEILQKGSLKKVEYLANNLHNGFLWEHFDPLMGCQQSRYKVEFLIHSLMREWRVWSSKDGPAQVALSAC